MLTACSVAIIECLDNTPWTSSPARQASFCWLLRSHPSICRPGRLIVAPVANHELQNHHATTCACSSRSAIVSSPVDVEAVENALIRIGRQRAALDAEEASWLREAERVEVWNGRGLPNAIAYLEQVLGYAPRTAKEKLRVARALEALPELTAALAAGTLHYSAVRELTRVVTPATERAWIAAARTKTNLRGIEELVSGHRPGDLPTDAPDDEARLHRVTWLVSGETFALMRQARTVLDDERGTNLDDDAFAAAAFASVLGGADDGEAPNQARHQVACSTVPASTCLLYTSPSP